MTTDTVYAMTTTALDQLRRDTEVRAKLDARRNDLILAAWRDEGVTWRTIATVTGMTDLACQNAARSANGGVKPERDHPADRTPADATRPKVRS